MSQARFLWKCIYWSPLAIFPTQYVDVRYITGTSMTPTLNPDTSPTRDLAVFESYSRVYKRGDIVHLRSPSDMSKGLVKRIVALPGDTVQTLPPYNMPIVTVPPGHVWVEGDEWFHSDGSNHFGPIHIAQIRSKLVGLLWPLNRFGRVPQPPTIVDENSKTYEQAMITIQQASRIHIPNQNQDSSTD